MTIDRKEILAKVEGLVAPVLANLGYDLIEREIVFDSGRWVLRLFIDREGGVTIDDCVRASHSIEDLVAVEDVVPVRYDLEVSSPGIFRPLRRPADFEKYAGMRVRVRTAEPIDGRSNFKGILERVEGGAITIIIDGDRYQVPIDAIEKARLEPEELLPKGKSN
ncbi:MAG: ribosome maturation factor RimP [bacterium]